MTDHELRIALTGVTLRLDHLGEAMAAQSRRVDRLEDTLLAEFRAAREDRTTTRGSRYALATATVQGLCRPGVAVPVAVVLLALVVALTGIVVRYDTFEASTGPPVSQEP